MSDLIAIEQSTCINYRYTRMRCGTCRAVCPAKPEMDEELGVRCTDCGLCIAACPADAVSSESYSADAFERLLYSETAVPLACRKRHADSDWPCLGFLNERMLLALVYSFEAGRRPVLIDNALCAKCNLTVSHHIEAVIAKTNVLLRGLDKKLIAVTPPGMQVVFHPKAVSRKHFFRQLFGAAVTTVAEVMVPVTRSKSRMTGVAWFERFAKPYIDSAVSVDQQLFKTLHISSLCDGCGICTGICPRKALTVELADNILQLQHEPVSCTGCGVCMEHCPHKAITITEAGTLQTRVVSSAKLPVCRDCGSHFQPVGGHTVCMDCLLKAKIQVIW